MSCELGARLGGKGDGSAFFEAGYLNGSSFNHWKIFLDIEVYIWSDVLVSGYYYFKDLERLMKYIHVTNLTPR